MLTTVTKKLCPLLTLAFATVGCGKKIGDATVGRGDTSLNNQELSSIYHLSLNSQIERYAQYRLPEPASFYFPEFVDVVAGTITNQVLEISYDVNELDTDFFLMKCYYSPTNVKPNSLILTNCVNQFNQNIDGSMYDYKLPLRKDHIIQLKFSDPNESSLVVNATYRMNWVVPTL